jgi:hypothetical protein
MIDFEVPAVLMASALGNFNSSSESEILRCMAAVQTHQRAPANIKMILTSYSCCMISDSVTARKRRSGWQLRL